MKILHTIEGMSAASGGPSSCLYNLVKGLNNIEDVSADILGTYTDDALGRDDDFVHLVPDDRRTPLHISKSYGKWLKEHVKNYDIVHINGLWAWHGHQAFREAKKAGKIVVISPHGMLYPAGLASKPWKKKLALTLYQKSDLYKADALHATCEREADILRKFGLKQPICVLPNCIPDEVIEYKPTKSSQNNRIFGFVGRLHPVKNIDRILQAWLNLGTKTDGWQLHIIGSGEDDYERQLRTYVSTNNMKNVIFRGFLHGKELDEAINNLSYLILASVSENFGMVVAEALAKGIPAIVTTGAPWSELVSHNCGWWVNPTPDELAEVIQKAIENSASKHSEMSFLGKLLIKKNYIATEVAKKIYKEYQIFIRKQ